MSKNPRLSASSPFSRFKENYTPLYRTLLVLSSLAVLISIASITNIKTLTNILAADPLYAISGLAAILLVLPLMIASLILLWHKHPTGIRLRLAGYAVSTIATVLGFFVSEATIGRIARDAIEASKADGISITMEMATTYVEFAFYGSLYIVIGANILFAWLWWKAWKRQVKIDTKKHTTSHQ